MKIIKAVTARINNALRLSDFNIIDGFDELMKEYFGVYKIDVEDGLLELMIFAEFRIYRKSERDYKLSKIKKKGIKAWCRRSI